MIENYNVKSAYINGHGIDYTLVQVRQYEEEDGVDQYENEDYVDYRETYFIPYKYLIHKRISKIFDFLTNTRTKYLKEFFDISEKKSSIYSLPSGNDAKELGIDGIISNIKENNLQYILDYNLVQILDLASHNNHGSNYSVINLKSSDTRYSHEEDDLVHDRVFFYANNPEEGISEAKKIIQSIINLFSSDEISNSKLGDQDSAFSKINFFNPNTQISEYTSHVLGEKESGSTHSKNSINLIYNLISNGDKKSFYSAYHLIMDNHSFKDMERGLLKSVDLTNTKIHVPWKMESRNESEGDNLEDMYLPRNLVSENHLISLKKLFFKILAETAPVTYFLDSNYLDSSLKAYTKAAVTSFILVGSQNDLLDTSDKKSRFSESTFMYIFSQLYLNGTLDNLEDIGGSRLFERIEFMVQNSLTNADIKRILNMIVPYANSQYGNMVNVYNNGHKYLAESKNKEEYNYILKKLEEVKKALDSFSPKFSKIQNILFKELQNRNKNIEDDFSENYGFKINESDFNSEHLGFLNTNTSEEIFTINMESGNPPSKEDALLRIKSENNEDLALFCFKNKILDFSDLESDILLKINILNLNKNELDLLKESLIEKNIYESFCTRFLKNLLANKDLKSIHDIFKISKSKFLMPFFNEKENESIGLFSSLRYIKRNKKYYFEKLLEIFDDISELVYSYNKINKYIPLYDLNLELNKSIKLYLLKNKDKIDGIGNNYIRAILEYNLEYEIEKQNYVLDMSKISKDIFKEIMNDKIEIILSMYTVTPNIFNRKAVPIAKFKFLEDTYTFILSSNKCVDFIDNILNERKEDLLFAHLNAGGKFIERAMDLISSKKINSEEIESALSKKINHPDQVEPIIRSMDSREGSFSYLIKVIAGFEDPKELLLKEELDIEELLLNKKNFVLNLINSGISNFYINNINKFIDRLLNLSSNNDYAKKVAIFILNNIYELKNIEELRFKKKSEINKKLLEKNFILNKNVILKDEIENLDYLVVFKSKKDIFLNNTLKDKLFEDINKLCEESNLTNVNKVIRFIKAESESEVVYKEIKRLFKDKYNNMHNFFPGKIDVYKVIQNDILAVIKLQDEDEVSIKIDEFHSFYKHLLYDTESEHKSMEVESLDSLNTELSNYFLKLASNKDISNKLKFIYLILSYGLTINSNKKINFKSLRSISGASNVSGELKASLKKLFKKQNEENLLECNDLLFINSMITLDKSSEYLFKEILKEKNLDFSKNSIKFISALKSDPLNLDCFKNFCLAVYDLRMNLSSITLPLKFSSIEKFIKSGMKQNRGASKDLIKKYICSEDCKDFYDFPFFIFGFNAKSLISSDYNEYFIDSLGSRGYSVGGINLSTSSDEFYLKIKEYCSDFQIKEGSFFSTVKTKFSLNKEFIFSKFSEIFKFLTILKSMSDGIDDEILDKYEPKNEIFSNFNLDQKSSHQEKPKFRTRVIPDKDAYALIVGVDTGCCQHIGGAANDVCIESLIGKDSGVIMFEKYCKDGGFGYLKSSNEEYCLFGQAFTSIFEEYVILDNIEFNSQYASIEGTIECLKLLYESCEKIGKKLICGPSGDRYFDKSLFSAINIEDKRVIWSGPIKNTYSDFKGVGLLIEFSEEKKAFYFKKLIKLSRYIELKFGYSKALDMFELI